MRVPPEHGISGIAASNIRDARESHSLTRSALAQRMNSSSPPPSDGTSYPDWPQWTEQRVVTLEHGHRGRTPNLDIDELYAVCETLEVTLFDLLLPEPDDATYARVSQAFFGFELTPLALAGLRWNSGLAGKLKYHPDVQAAGWEDEIDFWRTHSLAAATAEDGDAAMAAELRQEAMDAVARRDGHQRLTIERLIRRVLNGDMDEPQDETIDDWFQAYADRLVSVMNDYGGNYVES